MTLATENHLEAIIRKVRELLAGQVEPNVALATYGGDIVELANLPALVLYLPVLRRAREEADNEPDQVVDDAGNITEYPPPRTYDLLFRYELVADPLTLARHVERLAVFLGENGALAVTRATRAGGTETVRYALEETQEPAPANGDGQAHRMAGQFAIRSVQLRATTASGTGKAASTLILDFQRK